MLDGKYFFNKVNEVLKTQNKKMIDKKTLQELYKEMKDLTQEQFDIVIEEKIADFFNNSIKNTQNIQPVTKPIPKINELGIKIYNKELVNLWVAYQYKIAGGSFNCLSEGMKKEIFDLEYEVTYSDIQMNIYKEKGLEGLDEYYKRCESMRKLF